MITINFDKGPPLEVNQIINFSLKSSPQCHYRSPCAIVLPLKLSIQIFHGPRYACLPARTVTERNHCQTNSNCYPQSHRPDLTCVSPSLENSSRLVKLVHSRASPVLFLGNVNELLQTVTISNYIPRWIFVPNNLPFYLETFFV